MGSPVDARVSAVRTLAHGLTTYERGLQSAIASARSDLNRACADMELRTAQAQTAFDRAAREAEARQAELDRCAENCSRLAHACRQAIIVRDECKRRWEKHKRALPLVQRAAADLLAIIRTIEARSADTIPRGRQHIQDYATILEDYLRRTA